MTPLTGVDYLLGTADVPTNPLHVFHDAVCAFMAEFSAVLLASPVARELPDVAALAFWARKANVRALREEFDDAPHRLGRGVCLHIAPANIPVNFAFSWLFGLLAGNANIVRLPSRDFPQVGALVRVLEPLMARYPEVARRTALVRYPRDEAITAAFSAKADARMIWGGDATIARLRALPTAPRCVDITFADRYSVALLDGEAVRTADETRLRRLAEDFYNDTFLMDQNACSSPQLVLWQHDDAGARERFWEAVDCVAREKYALEAIVAVDKYAALCGEAVMNPHIATVRRAGNMLYRIELAALDASVVCLRGHGGYFHEYALRDWRELFAVVTDKFQTVTCFGVDMDALRQAVIAARCRGVDRIVPVGRAMDIGAFWDGHDIVRALSRLVSLR